MGKANRQTNPLREALKKAESVFPSRGRLPRALPLAHTTKTEFLTKLLAEQSLRPRYCRQMRRRAIFLFYGGLFYRGRDNVTTESSRYPVGLLFHPAVSSGKDCHYPFDTGAIAKGLYGRKDGVLRTYKTDLTVDNSEFSSVATTAPAARLLVKHLFEDNTSYIRGEATIRALDKPDPIPSIFRFYVDQDETADHRKTCIEIQREEPLPLDQNLLWMAYPETFQGFVDDFIRAIEPHVPATWPYPAYMRFRPSELCSQMQGKASDVLNRFLG